MGFASSETSNYLQAPGPAPIDADDMKQERPILFIALLLAITSGSASGQGGQSAPSRSADFMFGFGSGQTNLSLSYQYAWKFGKKKRLELGAGVRFSTFLSSNKYFVTAPAKIVKGESGPQALFKEAIPANMDSVQFPSAAISSLNMMLSLGYRFSDKFMAGLNIDVIGFSFGGKQSGTYINGSSTQPVTASPSAFNLLLVGENDLGSLNSEFFVAYSINEVWAVKLGIQHIFMEYTTDSKVQQFPEANDRFRITPTVVCAGVVLTIR